MAGRVAASDRPGRQELTTTAPTGSRAVGLIYNPGLDGLRAVAVLAVLLYHGGLSWIPGGFLGVEVFFVLSGYLITLLLLTEYRSSGRINLVAFWMRRARRLLPALFLVLGAVTIVTIVAYRSDLAELREQLFPAVAYYTNWYLIVGEQSYFAAVERPPVLQHLWSLAIEEQFYLSWPFVLGGLLLVCRRRRLPMAILLTSAAAASALWMATLYQPELDPSRVYYGTDTRAAGLLLGAALATVWAPTARDGTPRRTWLLDALGFAALAGLAMAFARLNDVDAALYRGGFGTVSLLTAAVIAAIAHPDTVLGRSVLGATPLTWIGKRSYGLYLWHWPIFVYTRPEIDVSWGEGPALVLRLLLTLTAAELSYRFVELPVRGGALRRWLHRLRPSDPGWIGRTRAASGAAAVAVLVAVVGLSLASAGRALDVVEESVLSGGAAGAPAAAPVVPPEDPAATEPALEPRTVTVLADSVLLGVENAIVSELAADGWTVDYRGKPALMVKQSRAELAETRRPVGSVVIVGLGHNSLWEREGVNHDRWAALFDREADALVATLTELGAKRIVWVTLREPSPEVVPPRGKNQYRLFAWVYPYANERLRALPARHPDVILADWTAVSNRAGLTYDAVHLTPEGTRLMIDTIRAAARM